MINMLVWVWVSGRCRGLGRIGWGRPA